ncbi:hypothetical protein [Nocardia sp. NPDC024068]
MVDQEVDNCFEVVGRPCRTQDLDPALDTDDERRGGALRREFAVT